MCTADQQCDNFVVHSRTDICEARRVSHRDVKCNTSSAVLLVALRSTCAQNVLRCVALSQLFAQCSQDYQICWVAHPAVQAEHAEWPVPLKTDPDAAVRVLKAAAYQQLQMSK